MSDHLIPVTAAQLKQLPDGVLLLRACHSPIRSGRLDRAHILVTVGHDGARALGEYEGAVLDLRDTVTRAVVAACVVRRWLDHWYAATGNYDHIPEGLRGANVDSICSLAVWAVSLTPDQITTLARLARAALEAG